MHFFYLASPDLLFGFDADPAKRNVIGLIAENPDLATKAVKLRSFGQGIIKKLAGKKVHPNHAIPGGVNSCLSIADRDEILGQIDWAIAQAQLALELLKGYYNQHSIEIRRFANFSTGYMGMVDKKNNLKLYDGNLRLIDRKGIVLEEQFDPAKYLDIINEHVEDWSYLKFPFYKPLGYPAGIYRTGPLARLNVATGISTPLANKELKSFKKLAERNGMVEGSMYYHYARLIELLYAIEWTRELLENEVVCSNDIQVTSKVFNEQGIGFIEAPRGALFHHYWVDKSGKVLKVNLIVATGHNNFAMNQAVYEVAKDFIKKAKVTEGILNRVEAAIRCYDPCLSCSTHALGQMPYSIRITSPNGELIKEMTQ
jgi:NAD-reducing hydrogenase large subunit